MKLAGFTAVATLVLISLASAFPQAWQNYDTSGNVKDHMDFTRELAEHNAKLDTLKAQHDAMSNLPERMARIEEKLDLMSRLLYSMLVGLFALICKEIWASIKTIKTKLQVLLNGEPE